MKKQWVKPQFIVESFELEQHIAAGCTDIPTQEVQQISCGEEHNNQGNPHIWSTPGLFTSQIGCSNAVDNLEELYAYGKSLGGDANSWGSGQHIPALTIGGVLFTS